MTRRIFAVAAVLAVATAATAFAQASVAGTVETRFSVLRGNLSDDDSDLVMGGLDGAGGAGAIGAAWLQLSGTNADGTLGGLFRLRNTDIVRGSDAWFHRVFAWWRPTDSVRVWLGIDQDGLFDTAHFAGWGFHAGDNDYMFNHHWDFWRRIFPGNWDTFGMALSFANFGVDGLAINLVLPTGARNWPQATNPQVTRSITVAQMLAGFRLHSTFAVPGAGTLQFTYNAPGGIMNIDGLNTHQPEWGGEGTLEPNNFGQLGLSFLLTALDFGNVLFGGAFIIPNTDFHDPDLHLGAALDIPAATLGDVMGLRFRVGAHVLNRSLTSDDGFLTANVMPIVGLGPGSLMFDLGLSMALPDGDFDAEYHLGWSVKPVYRLPLAQGAFSIGLHLWSGVQRGGNAGLVANNDVHIHIPMLLRFSF